ncbi:MAG TPA: tRNA (guanine-N7)-methyltransferase [Coprothermobacter proteolyticus]|nr:tRNA (guanine-N7)-methyltransferase [Coprothermobacter proteolyticus]HPZ44611.1 tRNA (guanine-N7)-methyltransferase [Coprothermobacter proteolyticus]
MLIKPQSTISFPLNWDAIFPEKNPLAVEIGFGNGKFLKTLETTGANVVGFEVSLLSVEKAMKVIDHTKTALLLMDGVWGLRELFSERSVDALYINFPLPWPHKKHASRRLFTLPKLQIYASRLVDNAVLQLQTDVKEYAEEAIRNSEESRLFSLADYTVRNEVQVGTKYEQKWVSQGKEIYKVVLRKKRHVSVPNYLDKEVIMPHAIVHDSHGTLKAGTYRTTFGTIKLWEPFSNNQAMLIPAIVSDDDFIGVSLQQRVYISVSPHREGFIVKLDNHADVFKTENVKSLIWLIANQISNGNIKRINVQPPSKLEYEPA